MRVFEMQGINALELVAPTEFVGDAEAATSDALAVLEQLDPGARAGFQKSALHVALRALETRLLSDPVLRNLAQFWDAYVGASETIIRDRLAKITGREAPDELVRYLKSCIRSESSRYGSKGGIPLSLFATIVEQAIGASVTNQLRCSCCGYHFLDEDIGEQRKAALDHLDIQWGETIHPVRLGDPLKPWQLKNNRLTQLTVDHQTPEAGFGWTDINNLVVLCLFCNNGKIIYRRSGEPISTAVAASLQALPVSRAHSVGRQVAIVSAIATARRCSHCSRGVDEVELTVVLPDEAAGVRWLAPWACQVTCYGCLAHDRP
jgi:hypothetical protein